MKMIDLKNLLHDLSLTTRQKTKLRNTFQNNISTYQQLSKA